MLAFSNAKINLGLFVNEKRADGYHNIETCLYPITWSDIIEILPADTFSITINGLPIPGDISENTIFKAHKLLMREGLIKKEIRVHLQKNIPSGSGLGGASSNGAFALKLLNDLFQLNLSLNQLTDLAAKIGSDCPFFIKNTPQIATQTGTVLSESEISLKGTYIFVVFPNIPIATAEAYNSISPSLNRESLKFILQKPINKWKELLFNDFENQLFKAYPDLEHIKNKLYQHGALYASLTGSGSAIYGLFDFPVNLKKEFSNFTCWSGLLD